MKEFTCDGCKNTFRVHLGGVRRVDGKPTCSTCFFAEPAAPTPPDVSRTDNRVALARSAFLVTDMLATTADPEGIAPAVQKLVSDGVEFLARRSIGVDVEAAQVLLDTLVAVLRGTVPEAPTPPAPTMTARHARMMKEHVLFERARTELRAALVARGVVLLTEKFGPFSVDFANPVSKVAITLEERPNRTSDKRAAAIVDAGWKHLGVSVHDAVNPTRLRAILDRLAPETTPLRDAA